MFPSTSSRSRHGWFPSERKQVHSIDISIDHHFESKIYTSGSAISGCVPLDSQSDLPVEAIEVALVGTASTYINVLNYDAHPTSHTFLQLDMPVRSHGLLEASRLHVIPFTFVVPFQLPIAACKHPSTMVRDRHRQPPPW
ncbi:hypothetical protein ACJZ2D_013409 [Fusarium nematophilum]